MNAQINKTPSLGKFLKVLGQRASVGWQELDPYLEVGPERFDIDGLRIAKVLDRHDVAVLPVPSTDERESEGYDKPYRAYGHLRGDGVKAYESELSVLPRLNRVGEFRMARRHDFLRLRAMTALVAAGFEAPQAKRLLTKGELAGIEWPDSCTKSPRLQRELENKIGDYNEARNAFIEGTLYIVMGAVSKYSNLGIDTSDMIQEGNISLFQAIDGFDWRRSVRFKTYAEYWVNQAFLKMLYNNVRTVRIPIWVQKMVKKIKDLQIEAVKKTGKELTHEEIAARLEIPAKKVKDLLQTQRYAVSLDAEVGGDADGAKVVDLLEDERLQAVPDQIADVRLSDRLNEVMQVLPDRERMILNLRFGLDGKAPKTLMEIGQMLKVSAERVRQLQESALRRLKLPGAKQRLVGFAS